jgi:fucose permease
LLKIFIYLFGLAGGAINGATNALVADISHKDKGTNLSLLGVFFAIGALGMPFVLGVLKAYFSFATIVAAVGFLALLTGLLSLSVQFPPAKQTQGSPVRRSLALFTDQVLLLIALFLFFQSSLEAIIHNWVTLYLMDRLAITESSALYALSLNVAGMAVMRLLTGSIFRGVHAQKILIVSLVLMLAGCMLLRISASFHAAVAALVILGSGMAGGFPIMLAFAGDRYKEISGTAFSFVLVIALTGNMLLNYFMGIIAHAYGIRQLTSMVLAEIIAMILLGMLVLKRIKNK